MTRVAIVLVALALAACASPEATRMRAGGPGADVGNRSPVVEMHEGSQPFWKTPARLGPAIGMTDLAPAQQADRLSRGEAAASPRGEPR